MATAVEMLDKSAVLASLSKLCASHTPESLNEAVDFWFDNVGLPSTYHSRVSVDVAAAHIASFMAAKLNAVASGNPVDIEVAQEFEDTALYFTRSFVTGASEKLRFQQPEQSPVAKLEQFIEDRYYSQDVTADVDSHFGVSGITAQQGSKGGKVTRVSQPFRLQAFRSQEPIQKDPNTHLRLYFMQQCKFANDAPAEGEKDLAQLGDTTFLSETAECVKNAFQSVMTDVVETQRPVFQTFDDLPGCQEPGTLLLVGHKLGDTHGFFLGIPAVYRYYDMYAHSKFVEIFSNGVIIFALFLNPLGPVDDTVPRRLRHIKRDVSLHFCLPSTGVNSMVKSRMLNMQQAAYIHCAAKFTYHFIQRGSEDHRVVEQALAKSVSSEEGFSALARIRAALNLNTFNEGIIYDCIYRHSDLVKKLYSHFQARLAPTTDGTPAQTKEELIKMVMHDAQTESDRQIFLTIVEFNTNILKTNFYKRTKQALSFRLNPEFVRASYPDVPFAVFFFVGAEFRGFHVRFRDIARGGVRMVRSRFRQAFASNLASLFEECYNLANTQQRKNKDIPEAGSKGVILLGSSHQDQAEVAFRKYVDSLLDLLLSQEDERIVDHYKQEELVFLGPDEGTAEYMDWASKHARVRGYKYWKAFSTGKSTELGGIPHDTYGMTTQSVRAYVEGIQRELELNPAECTKFQTGGPDGDLGSNEIKLGKERTVAVVDGSGVAFNPEGLDMDELRRLADGRQMVNHYKLKEGEKSFFVSVEDTDFETPSGAIIPDGLQYRNVFHLNPDVKVDFFVPCGGRPASVNVNNVKQFLYNADGELRCKYIVEGANLFFTQEARLIIEAAGVILIKDASANKGGVTSSSLEVLAALSMEDGDFMEHMTVKDGVIPQMYTEYVNAVQKVIVNNAEMEFNCMWKHQQKTGEPMSIVSDKLSTKIVTMRDALLESKRLFQNEKLKVKVMQEAIPEVLRQKVGLDNILARLPEAYSKALFASYLASRFVYLTGLDSSELAFMDYVSDLVEE
eukprot:m.251585 g.251585  ORF g.251585 m.251585 type:complete len:1014 (-) comp15456_c0_seq2:420-3461(-)